MDWALCISRNRTALTGIVAALLVIVRCASGGRVPRDVRLAVLRILRPAESALRRLIVIAAGRLNCGMGPHLSTLASQLPAGRRGHPEDDDWVRKPLPDFSRFGPGTGMRAPSFRLIDPVKRFVFAPARPAPTGEPRVRVLGWSSPASARVAAVSGMGPRDDPRVRSEDGDDGSVYVNAAALIRRVAAMENALKRLPAQARRLHRLMARKARMVSGPRTVGPIRPGWPPGHRKRRLHPVDDILHDLHALALDMHDPPKGGTAAMAGRSW